jgi:hypothetical protein
MRRNVKILVLGLGVVLGYGSGFAGLCAHRHRREAFEQHVARVCVEAARNPNAAPAPAPRW